MEARLLPALFEKVKTQDEAEKDAAFNPLTQFLNLNKKYLQQQQQRQNKHSTKTHHFLGNPMVFKIHKSNRAKGIVEFLSQVFDSIAIFRTRLIIVL